MVSFKDLKEKIEEIEKELKEKNVEIDDVYMYFDYMNRVDDINFVFICDEYYGTFVSIKVI